MKDKYSVSVVFPMFNEKESIVPAIRSAVSFLNNCCFDSEIIVIDDGSTDGSSQIVEELKNEISFLKCVCLNRNKGIGVALRTGFNEAKNEIILYTDSDWPVDNEVLKQAFDMLVSEKADLLVGCRRGKNEFFYRRACSFFYNLLVRMIFRLKIKDVNCPLKLVYKEVINGILLKSNGPFINGELLVRARKKGYKTVELSFLNTPRKLGYSKFNSISGIVNAIKSTFIDMTKLIFELMVTGKHNL